MLDKMLDNLPSMISLFGALILSISVIYDLVFFITFGTGFSEMPTTLSDHLRSSLNWIPYAIFIIFAVLVVVMFTRRIEQYKTEEELIQTSSNPKFTARFRGSIKYIPWVIATSPIIKLLLCLEIQITEWVVYLAAYWILFIQFVFGHERIRQRTSYEFHIASILIPIFLIFIAIQGVTDAQEIKKGEGTQYVFDVGETQIVGTLARSFDKYFLIWDEDKKEIMLVSSNEVIQFYPQPEMDKSNSKIQPPHKTND